MNKETFRAAFLIAALVAMYFATTPASIVSSLNISDKVQHALAFCVLALLLDFSFPSHRFGFAKIATLLAYGLFIEVVQYFIPYRSFSLYDWLADGVGIALYLFMSPTFKSLALKLKYGLEIRK